ncbi:MAG: peptidylprolyl isomerase [Caldiserica bacterium]|jgi:foldase protein PrsA|nr:peptidylprolyl isomerase [Caldisericota bacterium]MDH7562809.1 peptidylprolyl isomerase [Caldisericota bacterium]
MSKKQRARKQAELERKKQLKSKGSHISSRYQKILKWVGIGAGVAIVILAVVLGFWYFSTKNVVAYVGGEKIYRADVDRLLYSWLSQLNIQEGDIQVGSEEWNNLWNQMRESLIQEKLALKEARRRGLEPSPTEIDEEIKKFEEQQGLTEDEIKTNLSKQGKTWEEFQNAMSEQILRRKIYEEITGTVTVTAQDIDDYFSQFHKNYDQTEQVALKFIFLTYVQTVNGNRSEEDTIKLGQELIQRIKNGEDFGELAKQYCEDNTVKNKSGDLGFIEKDDYVGAFGEQFQETAFSLKVGELSDLVPVKNGYGIFYVYDRKEPYEAKLDDPYKFHFRQIQLDDRQTAEGVLNRLSEGQDFAELAKSTSTDTTTASSGGDMGTIERNNLKKWQLDALWGMSPGSISGIIETDGKFYILNLVEVKTIKEDILDTLTEKKKTEAWNKFIEELKSQVEIVTL